MSQSPDTVVDDSLYPSFMGKTGSNLDSRGTTIATNQGGSSTNPASPVGTVDRASSTPAVSATESNPTSPKRKRTQVKDDMMDLEGLDLEGLKKRVLLNEGHWHKSQLANIRDREVLAGRVRSLEHRQRYVEAALHALTMKYRAMKEGRQRSKTNPKDDGKPPTRNKTQKDHELEEENHKSVTEKPANSRGNKRARLTDE